MNHVAYIQVYIDYVGRGKGSSHCKTEALRFEVITVSNAKGFNPVDKLICVINPHLLHVYCISFVCL